ncbi:hypothetical protein M3I53_18540 [Paraburkholderia sp. CNPSo 3272]|uniref:hypothetical protein n=1 Tax=Paraburkholderia sp. CNPSo 3272 TaxID=2940931 RepID=UPI0020B88271|nr:hypothetical protein [Paraburkholderia sp. CNPSo 3272]MCP3725101.1 hypothetical protein [Paraburkholderia sp. CNPSo 3272]
MTFDVEFVPIRKVARDIIAHALRIESLAELAPGEQPHSPGQTGSNGVHFCCQDVHDLSLVA